MMENWAHELEGILEKELSLLAALTEIGERKREAIIAGDVEGLDKCLNEDMPALMQMERLEGQRSALLENAGLKGLPLSDLARQAGAEEGERLRSLLVSLTGALDRLKAVSELNNTLVKSRLEFYALLQGVGEQQAGYGVSGQAAPKERAALIDKKA